MDEPPLFQKWQIRSAACLEAALIIAVLGLALLRQAEDIPAIRTMQETAWQSVPRWRVFFAMHALILSTTGVLLGIMGTLLLWSPARWFILCGVMSGFFYYRLEPRYDESQFITFIHAAGLLLVGGMCPALFTGKAHASTMRFLAGICFLMFFVWSTLAGLLPRIEFENLAMSLDARLKVLSLILGGALLAVAFRDVPYLEPRGFRRDPELSAKFFKRTLLICLAMLVIASALLVQDSWQRLVWLPALAFVPAFMAVYAPILWFTEPAGTGLFSSGALGNEQSRFFVGALFQYLTLGVLAFSFAAMTKRLSYVTFLLGQVWFILYWLPALWFAWALTAYQTGAS